MTGVTDTERDDQGVVRGVPVLDLSHLTSPEELAAIRRIEGVAAVIVPESLAGAYAAIPVEGVAATVFIPAGFKVRMHTGPLVAGGDGLGGEDEILIVVGLLVITSPVTAPVPRRICVVGSVLAPRGSEAVLGPALAGGSGTISYYRPAADQDVRMLSGQVKLSGPALANAGGSPQDVLVVAGQVVVTSVPEAVGYQRVIVAGQIIAPQAASELLEPRLEVLGQDCWYAGDAPRFFYDGVTLGPDFFRLLNQPITLLAFDDLTIGPGVTEQILMDKVAGIVLFGDITAPAELIGALQVLTTDMYGSIRASSGPGD